ncbi:hypothetical protein CcI49_07985 [Frankia sp. CcI49]|uniref:hypothetical protein n=1 Tax=Frankia sp. CcI49 TaxID=1745382 RepID=UPI0009768DBC|nr:hypothetical protein [Frankia sp. CcI49]ONH61053.1 hypothetical protein CcI49_07985 [Frankia sp. CcI49]
MTPEFREREPAVITLYRKYVMNLLELDTESEERSPLRKSDYRRALFAILGADPKPLLTAGNQVTENEAVAYEYGQKAMLDKVVVTLGELWRPQTLAAPTDDPREVTRNDLP